MSASLRENSLLHSVCQLLEVSADIGSRLSSICCCQVMVQERWNVGINE